MASYLFKMDKFITKIREELNHNSDEKARKSGERFFREEIKLYGMKAVTIRSIARAAWLEVKRLPKKEIFEFCDELWKSGYFEEAAIAIQWSCYLRKTYEPADFRVFECWVERYVNNWACCDGLCNHPIGEIVMMYPQYLADLKKWTQSSNRWMRRASAVSLIIPARKGMFLADIFEIAGLLLLDHDDMVQKGYGWMLKSAGEAHQSEVFEFVMRNKQKMPRTALRYAIEKMPEELRISAMAK